MAITLKHYIVSTSSWVTSGIFIGIILAVLGAGQGGASAIFIFMGIALGVMGAVIQGYLLWRSNQKGKLKNTDPIILSITIWFISSIYIFLNSTPASIEVFLYSLLYIGIPSLIISYVVHGILLKITNEKVVNA